MGTYPIIFSSTWNNGTETTGTSYYFIPPGTTGLEPLELVPLEPFSLLIGDTDIHGGTYRPKSLVANL